MSNAQCYSQSIYELEKRSHRFQKNNSFIDLLPYCNNSCRFGRPTKQHLKVIVVVMLLLLLPDPFRGMEAWRMTMEPQKPGNSPGSGPEIVERQRVAKE